MNTLAKPTHSELDSYFASIESALIETLKPNRPFDVLVALCEILLVANIIPVIPTLVQVFVQWRNTHSFIRALVILVHPRIFTLLWWICYVLLSCIILSVVKRLRKREARKRERAQLSRGQMRFALCYRLVKNLRSYQLNGLEDFYDKTIEDWQRLLMRSEDIFPYLQLSGFMRYSWFKLDSETQQIVSGFTGIFTGLEPRIMYKRELAQTADCLELLASYCFCNIDVADGAETPESISVLKTFAQSVISLPALEVLPEWPTSRKASIFERLHASVAPFSSLFSSDNLLICFLSWWVLCFVLVVLGAVVALRMVPALTMDSIIVTCLIATPTAGAVTVVAVSAAHRSLAKTLGKKD